MLFFFSETCEKMYCAFGAFCLVDHVTQQAYCRCEETCPDVFAPVCGNDGVTYASLCQLQMSACSQQRMIYVHHQGPCGKIKYTFIMRRIFRTYVVEFHIKFMYFILLLLLEKWFYNYIKHTKLR